MNSPLLGFSRRLRRSTVGYPEGYIPLGFEYPWRGQRTRLGAVDIVRRLKVVIHQIAEQEFVHLLLFHHMAASYMNIGVRPDVEVQSPLTPITVARRANQAVTLPAIRFRPIIWGTLLVGKSVCPESGQPNNTWAAVCIQSAVEHMGVRQ